jgi:hypothetical protein
MAVNSLEFAIQLTVTSDYGRTSMKENDRWRITWRREKKVNGFYSTQQVVVYGIDNVEHIIKTVVPTDEWDVTPA